MKTLAIIIYIITTALILACTVTFGQQGNTKVGTAVYPPSNDNYISVAVSYNYAFNGTQFKIEITQVIVEYSVAMKQNEPELVNELRRRGIMSLTQQTGAGVEMKYKGTVHIPHSGTIATFPKLIV